MFVYAYVRLKIYLELGTIQFIIQNNSTFKHMHAYTAAHSAHTGCGSSVSVYVKKLLCFTDQTMLNFID